MKSLQFGSGNRNLVQNINSVISESEFGKELWTITQDYCRKYFALTHLDNYQKELEFNCIYDGKTGPVNYNKNNSVITMICIFYLHMFKIYRYTFELNEMKNISCCFGHSVGSFASILAAKQYENKIDFIDEYKKALLFAVSCVVRSYITYQNIEETNISDCSTPMLILNNIKLRMANKMITNFNTTEKERVEISLINSSNTIVISGSNSNLQAFVNANQKEFEALTVNYNFLECNIPFHCFLLNDAKSQVLSDNQLINFSVTKDNLRFPVLSTIDGSNYQTQNDVLDSLLASLLCKCVNWTSVITTAVSLGTTEIIDFGPMLPVSIFTKDCLSNLNRAVSILQI